RSSRLHIRSLDRLIPLGARSHGARSWPVPPGKVLTLFSIYAHYSANTLNLTALPALGIPPIMWGWQGRSPVRGFVLISIRLTRYFAVGRSVVTIAYSDSALKRGITRGNGGKPI